MSGTECPICFEICSADGEHRLVTTKCGHLFGHICLLTTLKTKKECPTCRKHLKPRDVVKIYDAKLTTGVHVSSTDASNGMLEAQLQRERELRQKAEREREDDRKRIEELERLVAEKETSVTCPRAKRSRDEDIIDLVASPPPQRHESCHKSMNVHLTGENSICNGKILRLHTLGDSLETIVSCEYNEKHVLMKRNVEHGSITYVGGASAAYTDVFARTVKSPFGEICAVNNTSAVMIIPSQSNQKGFSVSLGEHRGWTCCFSKAAPYEALIGTSHGRILIYDLRHALRPLNNILISPPTHGSVQNISLNDTSLLRNAPIQSMHEMSTPHGRRIALVQGGSCQILEIASFQGYIGAVEIDGSPQIHAFDVQSCPPGPWLDLDINSISMLLSRRGGMHITNSLTSYTCVKASILDSSNHLVLPKIACAIGAKAVGKYVGPISSRSGLCLVHSSANMDDSLLLACPDEYTRSVHIKRILSKSEIHNICQLQCHGAAVRQCGLTSVRQSDKCILASLSCEKLKLYSLSN